MEIRNRIHLLEGFASKSGFGSKSKFGGGNGGNGGNNGSNSDSLSPRLTHCESKMIKDANGNETEVFEAYILFIKFGREKEVCDALNKAFDSIKASMTNNPSKVDIITAKPTVEKDKNGVEQTKKGAITLVMNAHYLKDIIASFASQLDIVFKQLGFKLKMNLERTLINEIAKCPTQADIASMDKSIGANYMELLKNLQDIKVHNKMFANQVQNDWVREYGVVYALRNAMTVKMVVPNATFVTTANGWATTYNRTIKPGARKIIISMPNFRIVPKPFKDRAAVKFGFKDWDDAYKQLKGVSEQRLHAIVIEGSKLMGNNKSHLEIVYDVSDTIPPKDPSKDVWANQEGLSDNLTGILNPLAQTKVDAENKAKGIQSKQMAPLTPPTDETAKRESAEKKLALLLRKCYFEGVNSPARASGAKTSKSGLIISPNVPLSAIIDDIIKISFDYGLKLLGTKFNIIEPKMQRRVAGYACLGIALSSGYDINSHGLPAYMAPGNNYDEKECLISYKLAREIVPVTKEKNENRNIMGKNNIYEADETLSGRYISFDEFARRAMEELGTPEEAIEEKRNIKKNFVEMFNRMANL